MKSLLKKTLLILLIASSLFSSCRTEDEDFVQIDQQQVLPMDSSLANLVTNVVLNDGSEDNIIDYASCFSVQLPVTVTVNGEMVAVQSAAQFEAIETILDASYVDEDYVSFTYPITIITSDYEYIELNTAEELENYQNLCPEENTPDPDIECLDFVYPISYALFNTATDLNETISLDGDEAHFNFLDAVDENTVVSLNFPITVLLEDGENLVITDTADLESAILSVADSCDEDDDNDHDDDDCINCTPSQLSTALIDLCFGYIVESFIVDGVENQEQYNNLLFVFYPGNYVEVSGGGNFYEGTWSTSTVDGNVILTTSIFNLPTFSSSWTFYNIDPTGDVTLDLRIDSTRILFKCGDSIYEEAYNLYESLIDCEFHSITQLDFGVDIPVGSGAQFQDNQTVTLYPNDENIVGHWDIYLIDNEVLLYLEEFIGEYAVLNGFYNYLGEENGLLQFSAEENGEILSINCIDLGERYNLLISNTWSIAQYTENGTDLTQEYADVTFAFPELGTAVASDGATSYNGSWGPDNLVTNFDLVFAGTPLDALSRDYGIINFENGILSLIKTEASITYTLTLTAL